ncbi:MAG TPA: efflux RND transporter permease subunit [Candidatus Baltobacteraceae bacterium]|nr:efflux RND transporter permease subunit [Candidatus Baltobacteraceae bacterium]
MKFTRLFVERPTLVTVFLCLVLIAGTLSGFRLVKQQLPNYDIPSIQVLLTYNGASTTEMRDAIVRPLEDEIAGAPDLSYVETSIEPGQATIVAVFSLTSDENTDLVQVQGRVQNSLHQLPSDLPTPQISIYNPSEAVVVSLAASSSTLSLGALSAIVTNDIVPTLEQVQGISYVQENGDVTASIQVNVDPHKLRSSGFTLTDVINAISNNNVRAPGGIVYEPNRETNLDIRGDIQNVPTVANLLLGNTTTAATGSSTSSTYPWTTTSRLYRISDVANVQDAYETQRVYAYTNGTPTIELDVQKAAGSSEVTASNAVLAELPRLKLQYPQVNFSVLNVQSTYTEELLSGVTRTLIEGIIITAIVMLFFLRSWRKAVVVMIAVPASFLVTLAAMQVLGFTLDTVSLLGMTLMIGILVDDSIVVLENISRHQEEGEVPKAAAINGISEIGIATIVITLVIVVVFLPLSFLPGSVGLFLREFGLVVTVATLTSLFVSFAVTPALSGRWALFSHWRPWPVIDRFTEWFDGVRVWYAQRALSWGLEHRSLVVWVSFGSLVLALLLIPLGIVGFEYMPPVDRGELFVNINYPTGTPLATTTAAVREAEKIVMKVPDLQSETSIAGAYEGSLSGYINNGAIGQIHVFLKSGRRRSTQYWSQTLASEIANALPGAQVTGVPSTDPSGGISQPIGYVVASATIDPSAWSDRVFAALQQTPGVIDATTSNALESPQIEVEFNRNAARALDASIGTASTAVRAAYGGYTATEFTGPDGLKDVQVIYKQSDLTNLSGISSIPIRANNGSIITVGDIVNLQNQPAPPLVIRIDRRNVVLIGANVAPGAALSNVQRAFESRLRALHVPATITVTPVQGGNQQQVQQTVTEMGVSLLLSILLVYLLMVALYNGYVTPFIVMFTVPVAVVGALGALAITHQTLNLFSLIGSIMLVGLVAKNGILLVDFANQLRERGLSKMDAIVESAHHRFRPIVMTTFAMIAGMLPLALALDPGSQAERPLGIVVIGGLSSSLVLTLLLIPIMYLRFAPKDQPQPEAPEPKTTPQQSLPV